MSCENQRYLIIGGTPKAGTTSLHKWLADHPGVCPASLKETRFFLDTDYPLQCAEQFTGDNLEVYAGFFRQCSSSGSQLRLDATSDYLYSKAALRIADLLPQAKIVFILRDPVERMVSWYKYARQRGLISNDMNFEDYVLAQIGKPITPDTPTHLRALDQCRYEKYLPAFRAAFGERCLIIDFNDLKANPQKVMAKLCAFSGLEAAFYDDYQFSVENASLVAGNVWMMHGYNSLRRRLVYALHNNPAVFQLMKILNRIIKKLLFANSKQAERVQVSERMANLVRNEVNP